MLTEAIGGPRTFGWRSEGEMGETEDEMGETEDEMGETEDEMGETEDEMGETEDGASTQSTSRRCCAHHGQTNCNSRQVVATKSLLSVYIPTLSRVISQNCTMEYLYHLL